ncbi:hypothetical protein H5V45_17365 [Nocardioides sp. KIGAM211]|uniref:Uncharacterized protein n=1 Tax=Nocardioides luti TaxID=2761101 RepID=A0A7X0VC49_9ACTN|nr:hypothetical protein [Nocardioides luti]MBB6629100.1 hypothetical protein [Nocardioides luti]
MTRPVGGPTPDEVVVREPRATLLAMLVAGGFVEAGLVVALVRAVLGDGFTVSDRPTSAGGTAIGFVVLVPLALLLGLGLVALAGQLVRRPGRTVLTGDECRRERGGHVEVQVHRDQAVRLRYLPASGTTWSATTADDPRPRGLGRGRLHARLVVVGPAGEVAFGDGADWPRVVDVLRGWARQRPELVDTPEARALLLPDPEVAATSAPTGQPGSAPRPLPRTSYGLVALAVRTRDPWVPFLPDSYGQWHRLWSGRYSAIRARGRAGPVGLVARWVFLLLWVAMPLALLATVLVLGVVALVGLVDLLRAWLALG